MVENPTTSSLNILSHNHITDGKSQRKYHLQRISSNNYRQHALPPVTLAIEQNSPPPKATLATLRNSPLLPNIQQIVRYLPPPLANHQNSTLLSNRDTCLDHNRYSPRAHGSSRDRDRDGSRQDQNRDRDNSGRDQDQNGNGSRQNQHRYHQQQRDQQNIQYLPPPLGSQQDLIHLPLRLVDQQNNRDPPWSNCNSDSDTDYWRQRKWPKQNRRNYHWDQSSAEQDERVTDARTFKACRESLSKWPTYNSTEMIDNVLIDYFLDFEIIAKSNKLGDRAMTSMLQNLLDPITSRVIYSQPIDIYDSYRTLKKFLIERYAPTFEPKHNERHFYAATLTENEKFYVFIDQVQNLATKVWPDDHIEILEQKVLRQVEDGMNRRYYYKLRLYGKLDTDLRHLLRNVKMIEESDSYTNSQHGVLVSSQSSTSSSQPTTESYRNSDSSHHRLDLKQPFDPPKQNFNENFHKNKGFRDFSRDCATNLNNWQQLSTSENPPNNTTTAVVTDTKGNSKFATEWEEMKH